MRGFLADLLQQRVVATESMLVNVGRVQRRFRRDQTQRSDCRPLFFGQAERTYRRGLVELRLHFVEHRDQQLCILVTGLRQLAIARQRLVHRGQVSQRQFGFDGLHIGQRFDFAGHVHDIVVGETTHDVDDGVGLADVGEELIAETFAFRRTGDQPRDVHEFDDRRNAFLRLCDGRNLRQTSIRHLDNPDIWLDRAERIVFRRDTGLGQRVEQSRLADIRQADDSAFETHIW